MKRFRVLVVALALAALGAEGARAATVVGDLNNFDTLNDTGQTCYGFEIEIEGVHGTDITYTFDWNHYGTPKIREDNGDPAHPRVFVRYESTPDANGQWGGTNGVTNVPSLTNVAVPTNTPPAGHTCTDTSINEGCEHFGVGYYGVPTRVVYSWLVDDGAGNLVPFGSPVGVATPTWSYTPPAGGAPAQVVAAIPAPVVPIPAGKQFGDPAFVKVIKTISHNANPVELRQLVSADDDNDGMPDWQNREPDEVETEWKLLQANSAGSDASNELQGGADDMGLDGSEVVTRRYEFYRYAADPDTRDGETGEAMCSEVDPTTDPSDPSYLHGVGSQVLVTDANGDPYYVDCAAQVVVGSYIGAQMAGFDAASPLGLVDHIADGESGSPYPPRTVVVGGNSPYTIHVTGHLPPDMVLGDYTDPTTAEVAHGVLAGTPSSGGEFAFTVEVTDADGVFVSKPYAMVVVPEPGLGLALVGGLALLAALGSRGDR